MSLQRLPGMTRARAIAGNRVDISAGGMEMGSRVVGRDSQAPQWLTRLLSAKGTAQARSRSRQLATRPLGEGRARRGSRSCVGRLPNSKIDCIGPEQNQIRCDKGRTAAASASALRMADLDNPTPGTLNWRLSAHPITLVTFLAFRAGTHAMRH